MVVVFAIFVDMVALIGGFQCQQLELAIVCPSVLAGETNPPIAFFPCKVRAYALAFVSKFLHLVIIDQCSKVNPFLVRCAKNGRRIFSRHQFLCTFINRPFLYNNFFDSIAHWAGDLPYEEE
jgi:hypothetical protein